MAKESYDQIASEITHIFHGAWPMNFQSKVSSFAIQIKAVRDLVDLARTVCVSWPPRLDYVHCIVSHRSNADASFLSRLTAIDQLSSPGSSWHHRSQLWAAMR